MLRLASARHMPPASLACTRIASRRSRSAYLSPVVRNDSPVSARSSRDATRPRRRAAATRAYSSQRLCKCGRTQTPPAATGVAGTSTRERDTANMKRLVITAAVLAMLGGAAHANGWLLLCPNAPGKQQGYESQRQIRAFDTAAECEAARTPFEKRCTSDGRHKQLAITCDCECWPARTCN
jgi:hypothetical protein